MAIDPLAGLVNLDQSRHSHHPLVVAMATGIWLGNMALARRRSPLLFLFQAILGF